MECWFWNIDKDSMDFFSSELDSGQLRQGWGGLYDLDLTKIKAKMDKGAPLTEQEEETWVRCYPMLIIKEGDLIAVKNVPSNEFFTLVRVIGRYKFDINPTVGDYGHILPVEKINVFHRRSTYVDAPFIRALNREQNPIRVTHKHRQSLEELALLEVPAEKAKVASQFEDRKEKCRKDLIAQLKKSVNKHLEPSDVELLILDMMTNGGLASDYTAGSGEKGADLISTIKIGFGLKDFKLAIQVKKSEGTYGDQRGIDQIRRALEERNADAGLLVTTGDNLSDELVKMIEDIKSTGVRVEALYGEQLYERLLEAVAVSFGS